MNTSLAITTSESLVNILPALIEARKSFKPIAKTKKNTAFGSESKYAPHDAVNDAVMPSLIENNLIVLQPIELIDGQHFVVTTIYHVSGEFISSRYPLPTSFVIEYKDQRVETWTNEWGKQQQSLVKFVADRQVVPAQDEPQKFGSAITYARRYALQAILNVCADEDDDGNTASGRQEYDNNSYGSNKPKAQPSTPTPQKSGANSPVKTNSIAEYKKANTNGNGSNGNGSNGNGSNNRNGEKPFSLADSYLAIATLCGVTASERDPKIESKLNTDPNIFPNEVEKLALEWMSKRQQITDPEAFGWDFWDFMEPKIKMNDSSEAFLTFFKEWQSQALSKNEATQSVHQPVF